jgi:hypothetical protein
MDRRGIRSRLLAVEQDLEYALRFQSQNWFPVSGVEWALKEVRALRLGLLQGRDEIMLRGGCVHGRHGLGNTCAWLDPQQGISELSTSRALDIFEDHTLAARYA